MLSETHFGKIPHRRSPKLGNMRSRILGNYGYKLCSIIVCKFSTGLYP